MRAPMPCSPIFHDWFQDIYSIQYLIVSHANGPTMDPLRNHPGEA